MSYTDDRFDALPDDEFLACAKWAAFNLAELGHAIVRLEPGDATKYDIVLARDQSSQQQRQWEHRLVETPEFSGNYYVAHSFGPVYPWLGIPLNWRYVHEKWTQSRPGTDEWTARIIARFLTTLSGHIPNE